MSIRKQMYGLLETMLEKATNLSSCLSGSSRTREKELRNLEILTGEEVGICYVGCVGAVVRRELAESAQHWISLYVPLFRIAAPLLLQGRIC